MDTKDKQNLADAYMSAWLAVKNRPAIVTIEPHGWFTVNKGLGTPQRVRASALLNGLAILTARMAERAAQCKNA